jgi:hydrogenase maturation protease
VSARVLVAGIGNVFLSDDAFGVELAGRLAGLPLPEGVRVEDFGIRGIHLAYELLDGYDTLVLLDAVPMGEAPGTLALIEPERAATGGAEGVDADAPAVDAHTMSPDVVLATLDRLGGSVERVVIVGCQPADLREGMGLTPAVHEAVDGAVDLCLDLLAEVAGVAGLGNVANAQPVERGIPR